MSNNEYKDGEISSFIEKFSGEYSFLEGSIRGVEFIFRNRFYRITRFPTFDKEETEKLKEKFSKKIGEYEVIKLPISKYLENFNWSSDIVIGLYDNINDLLNNCIIEGVVLNDIVTSSETTFLGID